MIEGQFGNPPESYLKTILPLVDVARGLLEKDEELVPIAFVGNFATGKTVSVLLDSTGDVEKDRSALAIRMAAEMLEASSMPSPSPCEGAGGSTSLALVWWSLPAWEWA